MTKAIKHDSDKPRPELLPSAALLEISKVMAFGGRKYSDENWREGFEWKRLVGSAMRHLLVWKDGIEDTDPESRITHLAHLGCNVLMLLEHELNSMGVDNRHKPNKPQD